ncbi:MAG: hypothetical protein KGD64_03370 [Candidatus Heimdallarchaeota archaeon]|nr:hypothetical protein [Candidatus Heimdallarchaeota archaeon]
MSVDFLKTIRETERDCEQDIKNAEMAKQNAVMEAEKRTVLKVRDAEIQAREEASKILADVKDRTEKEFVKMLNSFEEEQNEFKAKAKKQEKKAIDFIITEIM